MCTRGWNIVWCISPLSLRAQCKQSDRASFPILYVHSAYTPHYTFLSHVVRVKCIYTSLYIFIPCSTCTVHIHLTVHFYPMLYVHSAHTLLYILSYAVRAQYTHLTVHFILWCTWTVHTHHCTFYSMLYVHSVHTLLYIFPTYWNNEDAPLQRWWWTGDIYILWRCHIMTFIIYKSCSFPSRLLIMVQPPYAMCLCGFEF